MPRTTTSQIPYWDAQPNAYREHWVEGNNSASRPVFVARDDWDDFRRDMLGFSQIVGAKQNFDKMGPLPGNAPARILRQLPEAHPVYPWMYAQELELTDIVGEMTAAPDDDLPEFDADASVFCNVTYKPVKWRVGSDEDVLRNQWPAKGTTLGEPAGELRRFVWRRSKQAVEALKLPGTFLAFDQFQPGAQTGTPNFGPGGDTAGAENATKHVTHDTLYYQWMYVPAIDGLFPRQLQANIDSVVGKVNDAVFDGTYAPGTLLCYPPEKEEIRTALGDVCFNINFALEYRYNDGNGWNTKYRMTGQNGARESGFYKIHIVGSTDRLYLTADFGNLFRVGTPPATRPGV